MVRSRCLTAPDRARSPRPPGRSGLVFRRVHSRVSSFVESTPLAPPWNHARSRIETGDGPRADIKLVLVACKHQIVTEPTAARTTVSSRSRRPGGETVATTRRPTPAPGETERRETERDESNDDISSRGQSDPRKGGPVHSIPTKPCRHGTARQPGPAGRGTRRATPRGEPAGPAPVEFSGVVPMSASGSSGEPKAWGSRWSRIDRSGRRGVPNRTKPSPLPKHP
jgi:hypothetical protein